ncbi:hypothetical protein [Schaalia cardiffensis]
MTAGDAPTLWEDQAMVKRQIEEELSFAYRGEAVDDGSIPMSEYGRAVIGYSQMIRAAVREIDPRADVPDVRVIYQHHGSFVTGVQVVVEMSLGQALMDWLTGPGAEAADIGLSLLNNGGNVLGWTVAGGLMLIQRMRGKTVAKREKLEGGCERITLEDGDQLAALTPVINVSINNYFRNGARDFILPTRHNGIDSVTFCSGGGLEASLSAVDLHSFDSIGEDAEKVLEEKRVLEVLRPAFDDGAWRFRAVPVGNTLAFDFSARIIDDEFLDDVAAGEDFRKGDQIEAIVRITVPKKTGDRVRRRYEVLEVIGIRKVQAAPTLFDEVDLEDGD